MIQFRILGYIIPRISQLLEIPLETTSLTDPLLKQEGSKQSGDIRVKPRQKLYHPPPYVPPRAQKVSG